MEAASKLANQEQDLISAKIEEKQERKKMYQALEKQLEESQEAQISTTDPDARAVVFQPNRVKVGYNVQAATDAKYKLLVAMDTGDVNDTKALSPMVKQVQENLSKKKFDVLAEVSIEFTCYNLVRIVSIWGFAKVLDQLRGLFAMFCVFFGWQSPRKLRTVHLILLL